VICIGYDMVIVGTDGKNDNYFGINMHWMGQDLRPAMRKVGLLDDNVEMQEVPDRTDFPDDVTYEAALSAWRAQRSPDRNKIPTFKFGSSDGWVITVEECRLIHSKLSTYTARDYSTSYHECLEHTKMVLKFAAFAGRAARAGSGFAVY
jgi:hypothetical protein